jgi:hypothetical protein
MNVQTEILYNVMCIYNMAKKSFKKSLRTSNKNTKHKKSRNRYTSRIRKQYGGEAEMSLSEIREVIIKTRSEYCGYMLGTTYVCNHIGPPKGAAGRGSCNQLAAPSIWHTHSTASKYYPSIEDINKILKHEKIHISKIFTQYGDWTMEYQGGSVSILEQQDLLNDTIFTPFYEDTEQGHAYNPIAVHTLVNELNAYLEGRFGINGFITWTPL